MFLLDLLRNPIWPHMHMFDTRGDAHTVIDRAHELARCAYLMWRAQRLICGQHIINQQARKLNCAKSIAVKVPFWMPLIFLYKALLLTKRLTSQDGDHLLPY